MKNPYQRSCLAAALLLAACSTRPVEPQFETRSIDTLLTGQLMDCRVEYRFTEIRNAAESEALEAIEAANIRYFFELEEFSGNVQQAAAAAVERIAEELTLPAGAAPSPFKTDDWGPGEVSVASEGAVTDTLLNYTISRWHFLGGAHGQYTTECHVYTLTDGSEITLAELFDEERIGRVDSLIRQRLRERYDAPTDEALAEKGFFPEYIAPTDNFLLTADGLTFHYNPYDVGCYALGAVEVTLTPEEVLRLRKP